MNKKCLGCGITLQTTNKDELGYTPKIDNDYCERCFKITHYSIDNKKILFDNNDLVNKINKMNIFTCYLVDFFYISNEVLSMYQRITNPKCLIITKKNLIPKNIYPEKIIKRVKTNYGIKEPIYFINLNEDINIIRNLFLEKKKVIVSGYTISGKSTLINTVLNTNLTISKNISTTLDFIKIPLENGYIYDTPGFIYKEYYPNIDYKKIIKPQTKYLDSKNELIIDKLIISCNVMNNITIFVPNYIRILKRKKKANFIERINIPSNSDLVIKGLGFIYFKNSCILEVNEKITSLIEVRDSLVGTNHKMS
jgi:ribosome biogenesis GTPase A